MVMSTTNGSAALSPEEIADLLVTPVLAASVATQAGLTATVVQTDSRTWRIPMVADDPAAGWVAEGAEISPSDAALDELEVVPRKLAGLTIVTRELVDDTSEEARQIVGDGLTRDITRKLDTAFVGNVAGTAAAKGLGSITPTAVNAGPAFGNLDAFAEAVSEVEQLGTEITGWIAGPATALTLAQLKDREGSNATLLGTDPAQPTRRIIEGRPVFVQPDVPAGVVWGIAASRVFTVIRSDSRIDVDESVFFTSDRVAIRGTMRVNFAFPQPAAVVKVTAGSG